MAMKIGEKIKELRKAMGISQESLSNVLGVSFQAVSKWETNTTTPDLSLIPAIASYFGITIDELFDYNVYENERKIDAICREAASFLRNDPSKAEGILRDGLRQFPANENMLTVLVYVLCALPSREKDLIETCNQLISCATNQGIRCDILRILAETYHKLGQSEQVDHLLAQIPEFYFTKMECVAKLKIGRESLNAARFQMNLSGKSLIEMLQIMAKHHADAGDSEKENLCLHLYQGVLDLFCRENGKALELPGYEWMD